METMLDIAKAADDVLMISSVHGLGKSSRIEAWAKKNGYYLKVLFTSLIEETDLAGIPVPSEDGKSTVWLAPSWVTEMNEAAEAGLDTIFFADELNRAQPQVLNAMLELLLNKEINGHVLKSANGKRAFVCGAINPADENYNVQEFDPALINRTLMYELKPDAESWLQWAQLNNVHPIIRRFIAKKPQYIFSSTETEIVTATPRSWEKLSDSIYAIEKSNTDKSYLYTVIKGKVGKTIGAEFLNFYNEYSNMILIDDIRDIAVKTYSKKQDFEKTIEAVKNLIKDQEPAIITDFANEFYNDAAQNENITLEDNISSISFFHAAPLELITSIISGKRQSDLMGYKNLAEIDRSIFKKIFAVKNKEKDV